MYETFLFSDFLKSEAQNEFFKSDFYTSQTDWFLKGSHFL